MLKFESSLQFHPLTPNRWDDFADLFGANGACGGCWCMYWRVTAQEFGARKGKGLRNDMKRLVEDGAVPGILAFDGGVPVGWCSVGPREVFPRLAKARTLKPIDDQPVWSVVCLFIARDYRNRGVSTALIEAAAAHVRKEGGGIVEGYPYDYRDRDRPSAPAFVWTGLYQSFERTGFEEVARPSGVRVIMRKRV